MQHCDFEQGEVIVTQSNVTGKDTMTKLKVHVYLILT